ncbi:hypothetical protein CLF_102383 [Clonorchis sinensis]|uniref:Uncharacterized protein n=1 Tax=Clonorchis sinensis TaxID=79923 RepID=G7Y7T2_CLOSI|nr:hypothetical protein CLF_102383 [Clonorchis sinensis]
MKLLFSVRHILGNFRPVPRFTVSSNKLIDFKIQITCNPEVIFNDNSILIFSVPCHIPQLDDIRSSWPS